MNLTTTYMGLTLKNPLVPSSSPLTGSRDGLRALEDAGASAVVLSSLFEERILLDELDTHDYLHSGVGTSAEATSYVPEPGRYQLGAEAYLEQVSWAKRMLDIPVIASLNGTSVGGWIRYAKEIENAGADGLELNMYHLPADVNEQARDVEQLYLDALKAVKTAVSIPVAMKLSPYFSAIGNMTKQLVDNGANGLVLFNRFYQPDLDIENLDVMPHLVLSDQRALRLPLRWVAMLYGRVNADFAITSGIHTSEDVLKGLMAGAKITMMASALLKNGPEHITTLLKDIEQWMEEHEYESVVQMQGSLSQLNAASPAIYERANYMKVLNEYRKDRVF
jgi:dihydroorotate dehydrogenase (fumarate)